MQESTTTAGQQRTPILISTNGFSRSKEPITKSDSSRVVEPDTSAFQIETMKIVLSLFLCMCLCLLTANRGLSQSAKISNFERDIAPILQDKCLSCHHEGKAKNGFVVSDRDAVLGYLEPGSSATSSLWTDYLTQPSRAESKDSLVMPPDGPMNPSQLAMIKLWIDEGADWPVGVVLGPQVKRDPMPTSDFSFAGKAFRAIGYFHPAMVHFPIALFLVGGVCAFLSYFLRYFSDI